VPVCIAAVAKISALRGPLAIGKSKPQYFLAQGSNPPAARFIRIGTVTRDAADQFEGAATKPSWIDAMPVSCTGRDFTVVDFSHEVENRRFDDTQGGLTCAVRRRRRGPKRSDCPCNPGGFRVSRFFITTEATSTERIFPPVRQHDTVFRIDT
jgi:hypothetical protein